LFGLSNIKNFLNVVFFLKINKIKDKTTVRQEVVKNLPKVCWLDGGTHQIIFSVFWLHTILALLVCFPGLHGEQLEPGIIQTERFFE